MLLTKMSEHDSSLSNPETSKGKTCPHGDFLDTLLPFLISDRLPRLKVPSGQLLGKSPPQETNLRIGFRSWRISYACTLLNDSSIISL